MNLIKTVQKDGAGLLDAVRLRKGMPVRMNDGRRGKVAFVAGSDVHVDLDGPNPHCTGIAVKRACVKIKNGVVIVVDLPGARPGRTKTPKPNREQRPAVVVDPRRAQLEAEWKYAPED